MPSRLALLHLRRGLSLWLLISTAALATLVLIGDPPGDWLGEGVQVGAWRKRELWSVLLLLIWPAALLRASQLVGSWRTGELDWLGPRTSSLGRALTASWFGIWVACCAGLCAIALLAEASGGTETTLVDRGWMQGTVASAQNTTGADSSGAKPSGTDSSNTNSAHASTLNTHGESSWTIALPATAAGAQLTIPVLVRGYSGPAVDAALRVRRAGEGGAWNESTWTGRLSRAHEVVVELPAGEGPATLTLGRQSDGATLYVKAPGARLLTPAFRGADTLSVLLRISLAAALSIALAIGFGAWVSAPTAALAVVTLWISVWLGDWPWSVPGDDLFAVLDDLGRGRAAGPIPVMSWITSIVGVTFGLSLARFGLARERRSS